MHRPISNRGFGVYLCLLGALFCSSAAHAALTWTASVSSSDGSPISSLTPGASLTFSIGVTTTGPGEILGLTASISGYDLSHYELNRAASTVPDRLFGECVPSFGCFLGIDNGYGIIAPTPPNETTLPGGLGRTVIFEGITAALHPGTGATQTPQFTIVFDPVDLVRTTDTVFNIGVFTSAGDNVVFNSSGSDGFVNNARIIIPPVPEPTTALLLGLGLAGLASRRGR